MKRTFIFFAISICAVAAMVYRSNAGTVSKTMKRIDDPLVIEAKEFPALLKTPIPKLSLMAFNGSAWAPIPFQIDQKKPDGVYCYTSGPDASTDPDPTLDANDELVFMVKDTGDRATTDSPPAVTSGVEIEVTDPKTNGKGWAYLFRFQDKPPSSKEDYIRVEIDAAKKHRRVVSYEYVIGGPMDRIYPDEIRRIKPDGSFGLDVLDRLKMRGVATLISGIKIPYMMDDITRSKDRGWIDGPVRVLHFADGYMELNKYVKFKGAGYSVVSYYVNHMIWPLIIKVPVDNLNILKSIDFVGYMDFNSNVYGSCPFSAANPSNKNFVLDGHMSEAEKNLDTKTPISWNAGFGPEGAIVSRIMFVPPLPHMKTVQYYIDDKTIKDPPETDIGISAVGYRFLGMETQSKVQSISYQYYYYLSKLDPKEVNRILDILDFPVKFSVKQIDAKQ